MSSRDFRSNMGAVVAFSTALVNTDTTTAGAKLDLIGFESCTFVLQAGVVTAGDAQLLIEDSADNTTFAAVSDTFLIGTEVLTNVDGTGEITTIGYVGKKRYVRASIVSDNSANLTCGAIAVKEAAHEKPASVS